MIDCVEDENSIWDLMIYTLNMADFEASGFSNGRQFGEAMKETRPELIMLDIMLPGEDGISILKKLQIELQLAAKGVSLNGLDYFKGLNENLPDSVKLIVSDTGAGIPSEYKERIFERFYRVDNSRTKEVGGTGLGLSIVKHGAIIHHAKILTESEIGNGTTFTVIFPKK